MEILIVPQPDHYGGKMFPGVYQSVQRGSNNPRPQRYHRKLSARKTVAERTIEASRRRAIDGDDHDLTAGMADGFIAELDCAPNGSH